jgi:hypothetical protein
MNIKLYDETDLRTSSDSDSEFKYEFIEDVPGDNIDIFGDYDNVGITSRLREHKVFGEGDKAEPVSDIMYVYFKDLSAGKSFIKRLNAYITEKATKVQDAQQF